MQEKSELPTLEYANKKQKGIFQKIIKNIENKNNEKNEDDNNNIAHVSWNNRNGLMSSEDRELKSYEILQKISKKCHDDE